LTEDLTNRENLNHGALAITVALEKELPDAAAASVKARTGKARARESDRIDFKQPHPILHQAATEKAQVRPRPAIPIRRCSPASVSHTPAPANR
jgi:hypothetical protein